jgi:hypothetical protein
MAVKSSGSLSITTDIVGEFGGVAPHSISEFYDGAGLVPSGANPNVPSSGAVSFSNFYGAVNVITISIINNQYDSNGTLVTLDKGSTLNLFEIANKTIGSNAGNNVVVPLVFSLDSDTVFNNSIIFGGSFTDITIENNGIITGRGGHGRPLSDNAYTKVNYGNSVGTHTGNAAIFVDSDQTKVTITNLEKGFIAGGGNGGSNDITSDNEPRTYAGASNVAYSGANAAAGRGGGGGWNGGRGGRGTATASAEIQDTSERDRDRSSSRVNNGGGGSFVTDRNTNSQGFGGSLTLTADAYATTTGTNLQNMSNPSASTTSGGSGLGGGSQGTGGAVAQLVVALSKPEARAIAIGVSGSGGGSGIGSSSTPNYVTSSGRNQSAGAGHSIQIKTGSTVSTKSTTNNGRIYGDTDIAIS